MARAFWHPQRSFSSRTLDENVRRVLRMFARALPEACVVVEGLQIGDGAVETPPAIVEGEILIADPDIGLVAILVETAAGLAFGIPPGGEPRAGRPGWYIPVDRGQWEAWAPRAATAHGGEHLDPVRMADGFAARIHKELLARNRGIQNQFGTAVGVVALMATRREDPALQDLDDAWNLPNSARKRLLFDCDFDDPESLVNAYETIRQTIFAKNSFKPPLNAAPVTALREAVASAALVEFAAGPDESVDDLRVGDSTADMVGNTGEHGGQAAHNGAVLDLQKANATIRALMRDDSKLDLPDVRLPDQRSDAPASEKSEPEETTQKEPKNRFLAQTLKRERKTAEACAQAEHLLRLQEEAVAAALNEYAVCEAGYPLLLPPVALAGASALRERHIETLRRLSVEDLKTIVQTNKELLKEGDRTDIDRTPALDGLDALATEGKRRGVFLGRPRGKPEDRVLTARIRIGGILRAIYRDSTLACARILDGLRSYDQIEVRLDRVETHPKEFGRPARAVAAATLAETRDELRVAMREYLTVAADEVGAGGEAGEVAVGPGSTLPGNGAARK